MSVTVVALFAARCSLFAVPLDAQAPRHYVETVTTEVTSRTATVELVRTLSRTIDYLRTQRGDTTVMQAVAVSLEERGGQGTTRLDTDGFTGGRWKLVPAADVAFRVVDRPFVPPALIEVNDLAAALDDFFPPTPPPLPVTGRIRDGAGRRWQRLDDSASIRRYRWEATRQHDTTSVARDTIALRVTEQSRETSQVGLDQHGEPITWSREIITEVTSRGGGRGVRATVRQRIGVHTIP